MISSQTWGVCLKRSGLPPGLPEHSLALSWWLRDRGSHPSRGMIFCGTISATLRTVRARGLIKCPDRDPSRARLEPDDFSLRLEILRFLAIDRHPAHLFLLGMAQADYQRLHGIACGRIDLGL